MSKSDEPREPAIVGDGDLVDRLVARALTAPGGDEFIRVADRAMVEFARVAKQHKAEPLVELPARIVRAMSAAILLQLLHEGLLNKTGETWAYRLMREAQSDVR